MGNISHINAVESDGRSRFLEQALIECIWKSGLDDFTL